MFAEEIRRAVQAMPRGRLPELSAAVWKGFAAGAIAEQEAQSLAELIEARKAVPVAPAQPRRVGSRPRSPESMERRRRWTSSGWLPPQLAARFTMAENAVLSVVAAEVSRRGKSMLTIGAIAGQAGVCKATVRSAILQAAALGLLTSEEWRLTAFRNAPNTVKIVSPEWRTWLRLRQRSGGSDAGRHRNRGSGDGRPAFPARDDQDRPKLSPKGGGSKFSDPTNTQTYLSFVQRIATARKAQTFGEVGRKVWAMRTKAEAAADRRKAH